MTEVGQCAHDRRVAPTRILLGHAYRQLGGLVSNTGSPRSTPVAVVPLLGDELAVPGQDGVGRHDGRHVTKHFPAQGLALDRQAPAFVVREANPLAFELAPQDSILFLDVGDDVLLMTVDPASQSYEEHLPRLDWLHERHYTQAEPVVASSYKTSHCARLNIWILRGRQGNAA